MRYLLVSALTVLLLAPAARAEDFDAATVEDIVVGSRVLADLDGSAIDAQGRQVFLERFIHAAIYKARPDVMGVVHTHSPGVIPFSVSQTPLRAIYHNAAFLAGGVPVFDIRKAFGTTNMLVRN